jgi:hypothetical protein
MSADQIKRHSDDERVAGKSKEADAKGLVARSAREETSLADMQLRESGEARKALVGLARAEFARLAGITLTQPASESEGPVEGVAEPILEQEVQLDERLKTLVVVAIDVLPEAKRNVRGKVRSGEEIARAIPDVNAFLAEVDLMRDGVFFELNEAGQLVMRDGCAAAYGLKDDFSTAKKRQTRVVYRGEDGQAQVIEGDDYFTVNGDGALVLSDAAKRIDSNSIIMVRGLPTLNRDEENHTGEYARMNIGQLENKTYSWTEDGSLGSSRARYVCWDCDLRYVFSNVNDSAFWSAYLGSRGVLRVNLNLES